MDDLPQKNCRKIEKKRIAIKSKLIITNVSVYINQTEFHFFTFRLLFHDSFFFLLFPFSRKLQIRYFFRSSSQKTENSTIAFTETMAAKSIMEVDNPSENSRRNNSSRSNRSFHNNSKQTAEKCKQEDEEKSIKYEDSHNSRGKQSFGDRSPRVSSNSKQTSIASRSTVSQSFQNIAFSWIFF